MAKLGCVSVRSQHRSAPSCVKQRTSHKNLPSIWWQMLGWTKRNTFPTCCLFLLSPSQSDTGWKSWKESSPLKTLNWRIVIKDNASNRTSAEEKSRWFSLWWICDYSYHYFCTETWLTAVHTKPKSDCTVISCSRERWLDRMCAALRCLSVISLICAAFFPHCNSCQDQACIK